MLLFMAGAVFGALAGIFIYAIILAGSDDRHEH